jgi:NTE family protein
LPPSNARAPDLLVLGGGGILGEAWMRGVLAGIEAAGGFDARDCRRFIGTSAGSIVAAALAGGVSAGARLGTLPEQPEPPAEVDEELGAAGRLRQTAGTLGGAAAGRMATLALRSTAGAGALARRAALSRVPRGTRTLGDLGHFIDELGLAWDGRLLVAAVELGSGRRVMFGAAGAPRPSVADAVQASCSIPGVFRPIRVGGRDYVDGGAWSPTNMDAAPVSRGEFVLCLNPTASLRPTVAEPAGAIGPVSRSVAAAEALTLGRRGAQVKTINPDGDSAAAMGVNLMSTRGRSQVIEAGLAQGRDLAGSLTRPS